MIENGIKPVYVFDGKPPDMKSGEVCKNCLYSCSYFVSMLQFKQVNLKL